ncbi:Uncharacterised protein [Mycobacteroides abscessus subsp. massiliense]|nr:Uncharacterised protein [Mycobacteroides abscessus subsp. massiliense]
MSGSPIWLLRGLGGGRELLFVSGYRRLLHMRFGLRAPMRPGGHRLLVRLWLVRLSRPVIRRGGIGRCRRRLFLVHMVGVFGDVDDRVLRCPAVLIDGGDILVLVGDSGLRLGPGPGPEGANRVVLDRGAVTEIGVEQDLQIGAQRGELGPQRRDLVGRLCLDLTRQLLA